MGKVPRKPRSGSPVSLRDSVLALALLLGAGTAFPGCGDDEAPAPTTPEPPPATPAPPAPEPTLTTPENLRVTNQGPDYIEWSWHPVAGAPAYQAQFSTEDTFTPADATYLIVAPQTSHRVEKPARQHRRIPPGPIRRRGLPDEPAVQRLERGPVRGATTAPTVALDTPQELRTSDLR